MGGKISVDVNNGRIMTLTQEAHDDFIILSTDGYKIKIAPGELVMLMNYYSNCKDGTEQSDYIKVGG